MTSDVQELISGLEAIRDELSSIALSRYADVSNQSALKLNLTAAWQTINDCDDELLDLRPKARLTRNRMVDRSLQRIHTGDYNTTGTLPYVQLRMRYLHTEASEEQKARWLTELNQGVAEVCNAIDTLIEDLMKGD